MFGGQFRDCWLMWEGPTHCGQAATGPLGPLGPDVNARLEMWMWAWKKARQQHSICFCPCFQVPSLSSCPDRPQWHSTWKCKLNRLFVAVLVWSAFFTARESPSGHQVHYNHLSLSTGAVDYCHRGRVVMGIPWCLRPSQAVTHYLPGTHILWQPKISADTFLLFSRGQEYLLLL